MPLKKITLNLLLALLVANSIYLFSGITLAKSIETIKVYGIPSGISTRYIGAVEGNVNFDIADLKELGINTYRIYGGMSRWEAQDDDGVYGWPSTAEIKTKPNIINWAWWDHVMTNPPQGSDYWWSGSAEIVWQGNARTIFSTLKQASIRPVLTIRNVDDANNPTWGQRLNPPKTKADWNEWWEHVFATVYWLNVRNNYHVDDFEIYNEPDNREAGWRGSQADYFELVKVAQDAINYVYKRYLPSRTYHIYAPVTVGSSRWPLNALRHISSYFNTIDIHDYDADISAYTQQVHDWMNRTGNSHLPLWLSEWGTYQNEYGSIPFALNLIKNMIRVSQSSNNSYIYGSHIFSLYDWGHQPQGLIKANGGRRVSYYAFRMGIRALQGGRSTFLTLSSNNQLTALTTKDADSNLYLLVVNSARESPMLDVDLSALRTSGIGRMWEFSSKVKDKVVANLRLNNGHATFKVPVESAILIQFK